ncbi:MAG: hypothetical protein ACHQRJ_04330 [Alphaproteobacteria bacterium]
MSRLFVKRALGAIAFAGFMTVGAAMASGPYDGQWNAHLAWGMSRCGTGDFPVTVTDNKLTGVYKGLRGTYQVSGTVAADGTFSGLLGKGPLTGKFSGDKFTGSIPPAEAACGNGNVQFERAK